MCFLGLVLRVKILRIIFLELLLWMERMILIFDPFNPLNHAALVIKIKIGGIDAGSKYVHVPIGTKCGDKV